MTNIKITSRNIEVFDIILQYVNSKEGFPPKYNFENLGIKYEFERDDLALLGTFVLDEELLSYILLSTSYDN